MIMVVANDARFREEYENFLGKGYKHIWRGNHQKFKAIINILYSQYKKCEASGMKPTSLDNP